MSKSRISVLIACLAMLVLLLPLWFCNNRIIKGEKFEISDPDSLFYYRIIDQAYQKGSEKELDYDNYGNFPYNFKIGYPRFYFWFFYAVKALCTKLFPSKAEFLIGLFPVITTTLTALIIVLALCYMKYPLVFLIFAAFMLLPTAPAFYVGGYSKWDYDHVLSLYVWIWLLSAMFYQDTQHKKWLYLGGVFAGLILGSWIGSLLLFFTVTIFCLLLWCFNSPLCKRYLPFCYITIFIAAVINSLIMLVSPGRYGYSLLDFGIIHVSAMFLASLGIYALSKFNPSNKSKILFFSVSAIVIVLFALIDPTDTKDLLERVSGTDPVFLEINELQPIIYFSKLFVNIKSLEKAINNYGFLIVFYPLFMFIPAQKLLKRESALLLQLWLIVVAFASFYQTRYIRIFGVGSCIYSAFILYFLWNSLTTSYIFKNISKAKVYCIFVFLLLMVRSSSVWYLSIVKNDLRESELDAYNWIRDNTPKTSGYYDNKKPEYGILAYWDYGHFINYYAQRPVLANNMQNGVKNMADIFSSKNEESAYRICEDLGVKYVFMTPDRLFLPSIINFWPAYSKLERSSGYRALPYNVERSTDCDNWFFAWLNKSFGLHNRGDFGVSSYFRMVFANSENNSPIFSTILFERVKGAKLILEAKPNSTANISLGIKVRNKIFEYRKEAKVSENGYVSFIIPYSCYFNNGVVSTGEICNISLVSRETDKNISGKVSIKERDVILGNQIATKSILIFK